MPINTLAKIDRIATETDLTSAPTKRKRRVSHRLAQVVALLTSGECKTVRAACARVGLTETHVSHMWKKPHVQVFLTRKCRETVASGHLRAASRLNELIESTSDHVSLDAVKHSLGIAGIKPTSDPQVSVSIEMKAGYVLDLREPAEIARGAPITQPPTIDATAIAARVASDP